MHAFGVGAGQFRFNGEEPQRQGWIERRSATA
jgi:hypothetical protein